MAATPLAVHRIQGPEDSDGKGIALDLSWVWLHVQSFTACVRRKGSRRPSLGLEALRAQGSPPVHLAWRLQIEATCGGNTSIEFESLVANPLPYVGVMSWVVGYAKDAH